MSGRGSLEVKQLFLRLQVLVHVCRLNMVKPPFPGGLEMGLSIVPMSAGLLNLHFMMGADQSCGTNKTLMFQIIKHLPGIFNFDPFLYSHQTTAGGFNLKKFIFHPGKRDDHDHCPSL